MSFLSTSFDATQRTECADLDRIEALLTSGALLSGLRSCAGLPTGQGITDMPRAFEMMVDQSVWDLPEPWPYQYFPGVAADELGRLKYSSGLSHGVVAAANLRRARCADAVTTWHFEIIKQQLDSAGVADILRVGLPSEDAEWLVYNQLANELDAQLAFLEAVAGLGGFDGSPLAQAYLQRLEAGTMACAWVGPLPEQGGVAQDCLRHLAPQQT